MNWEFLVLSHRAPCDQQELEREIKMLVKLKLSLRYEEFDLVASRW